MEILAEPVLPTLPEKEYEALKESIRERGVLVPIMVAAEARVVDGREHVRAFIVDGHERYRACRELKIPPAPLRVLDPMTTAERRELAIRLNAERRHLSKPDRDRLLEQYIKAAPHKGTREIADACKVSQSKAARSKARLLATESIDSVPVVGRNGKVYRRPTSVGVESLKGLGMRRICSRSWATRPPRGTSRSARSARPSTGPAAPPRPTGRSPSCRPTSRSSLATSATWKAKSAT